MASQWLAVTALLCLLSVAQVRATECWAPTLRGDAAPVPATGSSDTLARVEALLRANLQVAALPEVRVQLHLTPNELPAHPGAPNEASVALWLHGDKAAWLPGCGLAKWADNVYRGSLSVFLNSLRPIADMASQVLARDGFQAFVEPELTHTAAGLPIYGKRVLVIAPPGVPPLVPVSVGEYLDFRRAEIAEQIAVSAQPSEEQAQWHDYIRDLEKTDPAQAAELRKLMAEGEAMADDPAAPAAQLRALDAHRRTLSTADLAAPVYFSPAMDTSSLFAYGKSTDEGAVRLIKANPALWHTVAERGGVGVIALEVFTNTPATFRDPFAEPDAFHAAMLHWLQHTDPTPFRALLSP